MSSKKKMSLSDNQWMQYLWTSDTLLDVEEHIIVSHLNVMKNPTQKKVLYDWAFPSLEMDTPALQDNQPTSPTTTNDAEKTPLHNFVTLLKYFSTIDSDRIDEVRYDYDTKNDDISKLWDSVNPNDKSVLFSDNKHEFIKWWNNLPDNLTSEYSKRIENGLSIYEDGIVEFMNIMMNHATDYQFINISIINGMLAISCSDIIKLNQIKNIIKSSNAVFHEYRKKVSSDNTVIHTILFKLTSE